MYEVQPRRGIARCMLGSIHLQFVKNDQNNKTNINNTICIASQKNIYCLYPPHSTSVNKEVIDDFGGNCNGDCVSEEKGQPTTLTLTSGDDCRTFTHINEPLRWANQA